MSLRRHLACLTVLSCWVPSNVLSVRRTERRPERSRFARQHALKGRRGYYFVPVVVTIVVSWVPPTKTCRVAFKRLSGQMLPVTSDQRPAPLKSRSGFMK